MNHLEQSQPNHDQFLRGVGISFAIHALVVSLFMLKTVFFDEEQIDFSQAVRVDIVGLPEKVDPNKLLPAAAKKEEPKVTLPEKEVQKTPPPVVQIKPEPAKDKKQDDAVNLEKVKTKQQSAIEKLKAMAALEKIKQQVAAEKKDTGKGDKSGAQVKGNVLSPGTALTGLAKLQHDSYASQLDQHIKQNWSLPEWLAKRDFKAQARVFIDSHGNILGRKIIKSSGNPSYDEEVLATIDRSSPFPTPPEKFLAIVSAEGILIGFPE